MTSDVITDATHPEFSIGTLLKAMRIAAKLSRRDVAQASGLSPESIVSIENGTSDFKVSTLQRYCRALGLRALLDVEREDVQRDEHGMFIGHGQRSCTEHRTCGFRAWCFDCSEWCSVGIPCRGCEEREPK